MVSPLSPPRPQQLPFGMAVLFDGSQSLPFMLGTDRLERELYVPDDDLGSKSEAAGIAVRCLILALVEQGYDLQNAAGHQAIRKGVARIGASL